jgi:amino acid transporter
MTTKQPLTAPDAALSRSQTKRYLMVAGWVLWVALVFFVASFTVALVLYVLQKSQLLNVKEIGTAGAFWIDAALYMVMFIIVMWLPWLHWRRTRKGNQPPREKRTESWRFLQKSVGLTRSVRGEDWRYYVAGLPVFYITVLVLSIVAAMIFGDEVMNQTQEIGFAATNNVSELVFM